MVKVSITLPNNAQITFESEEPGVVEQVITTVLRDLPRDLMGAIHVENGESGSLPGLDKSTEKSANVVHSYPPTTTTVTEASAVPESGDDQARPASPPDTVPLSVASSDAPPAPPTPTRRAPASPPSGCEQTGAAPEHDTSAEEEAFIEFCRETSPMGDMRMVVVAAEGAARFLSMDSVDAPELERLFGLAGWRNPHSFVQTLRNAARSKFRWLARLPGRSGRYTVTDLGRATTLHN